MKRQLLIISLLLIVAACENVQESEIAVVKDRVDFCSMLDAPKKYKSANIQVKAIVLGYHQFIFYNSRCLETEKITALEMSNESRRKILDAIESNKINYRTSFLNNNVYAEIEVLGELKENDDKKKSEIFHPKYKFFVNEILNVTILSEEVFPFDETKELIK